jgi:hypothetical protein
MVGRASPYKLTLERIFFNAFPQGKLARHIIIYKAI